MPARPISTGGLMRCCAATLDEEDDGVRDTMNCKYCGASMSFRNDAWRWNRYGEIKKPQQQQEPRKGNE